MTGRTFARFWPTQRLCGYCFRVFPVNPVERPRFCSLACAERGARKAPR